MTRLEKSDAQLDAEAEVRECRQCGNGFIPGYEHDHYRPPNSQHTPMAYMPDDLGWLIAEARFEYNRELPLHLHPGTGGGTHTKGMPAGDLGGGEGEEPWYPSRGHPGWTGLPFTRAFERRMGIRLQEGSAVILERDYDIYPVAQAIRAVEKACRRYHRDWADHRGEPVCWTLLRHVIEGHYSPERAAMALTLTPERAELHLKWALRLQWRCRRDLINGWSGKRIRREAA